MDELLNKTAEDLTNIMLEHLETLSPKERKAKIAAGEKVLLGRIKTSLVGRDAQSGKFATSSSKARTSRSPLPARGR